MDDLYIHDNNTSDSDTDSIHTSNQLIIFMHFHKSGGTSIYNMFKTSGYNFHHHNHNGNPWDKNKQIIKYWNYDNIKLNLFLDHLNNNNINFIGLEWNFFKYYNEIDYNRFILITCIRDPYHRYKSNMNFYNNKDTILDYYHWHNLECRIDNCTVNYNKHNYYVRMLNGLGDNPNYNINETHLNIAKKNLEKFSIILILENRKSFDLLKKLNVYPDIMHNNKSVYKKKIINFPEIEEFKILNKFDYELYEFAKHLSKQQLENK